MKFINYENRHRKFSLNPPGRIQKKNTEENTFLKIMREVSGPYHSFVPHEYVLDTYNTFQLFLYTSVFTLFFIFMTFVPINESFLQIPYIKLSLYIIRDIAFVFLMRYIYLWYKNKQKIIISDQGIQIDKTKYNWEEIKSIEFKKVYKKTSIWYINAPSTDMFLNIKASSENEEEKLVQVNLYNHDVTVKELEYIISVCQRRNQKKIIKKNIALEEKFMFANK